MTLASFQKQCSFALPRGRFNGFVLIHYYTMGIQEGLRGIHSGISVANIATQSQRQQPPPGEPHGVSFHGHCMHAHVKPEGEALSCAGRLWINVPWLVAPPVLCCRRPLTPHFNTLSDEQPRRSLGPSRACTPGITSPLSGQQTENLKDGQAGERAGIQVEVHGHEERTGRARPAQWLAGTAARMSPSFVVHVFAFFPFWLLFLCFQRRRS